MQAVRSSRVVVTQAYALKWLLAFQGWPCAIHVGWRNRRVLIVTVVWKTYYFRIILLIIGSVQRIRLDKVGSVGIRFGYKVESDWIRLDQYEPGWIRMDQDESVWVSLVQLGSVCISSLDKVGSVWNSMDQVG